MEEILASIRKIISEDSTETQAAPSAAPVEADVLELTHEISEEPSASFAPAISAVPPPPVVVPEPAPVMAAPESMPETNVVFQSTEETAVSEAPAMTSAHDGIFSDKTRRALEDSFASIQAPPKVEAAPAATPAEYTPLADGASVQVVFEKAVRDGFGPVLQKWLGDNSDVVVDKLKPLVREWMDQHFPALLEGAVRAEVERVARARH
jgi:cell pole-organizing protein PopZ